MDAYKELLMLVRDTENGAEETSPLERHVLDYLQETCDEEEELRTFFTDMESGGGCASGMIPHLIYYKDTHRFFDRYYEDIERLRGEYEDETGCPINIGSDLKNFLAWFGFSRSAEQIRGKIGLKL